MHVCVYAGNTFVGMYKCIAYVRMYACMFISASDASMHACILAYEYCIAIEYLLPIGIAFSETVPLNRNQMNGLKLYIR